MKKLLTILLLTLTSQSYSQIRVVLKSKRIITASRVEFTADAVMMDEYQKINSKIYEMDKSLVKSIILPNGQILNFLYVVSANERIDDFRKSYIESKPTTIDSTKKISAELTISQDSLETLLKTKLVLPQKDDKVLVEEIVILKDSDKKNKIYTAIREWISKSFKSSKSVIDFEDKEEGKIICKGFYKTGRYGLNELETFFTLDFTIKDGKYRIQFYNFDMKENHYEVIGTKLNPYLPFTPIDIDKMNTQFASNDKKPLYRAKYSEEIISRLDFILKTAISDIKYDVQKRLSQQASNDF